MEREQENDLSVRSLKSSALMGAVLTLALFGLHQHAWGWGFLIGSLLSLFSMFTLKIAVPFLLFPGASPYMKFLLGVTLLMKLPIFCAGLYLATSVPGVEAGACCIGICLVPTNITLKAMGLSLTEKMRQAAPKKRVVVRTRSASAAKSATAAPERG